MTTDATYVRSLMTQIFEHVEVQMCLQVECVYNCNVFTIAKCLQVECVYKWNVFTRKMF